MISSLSDRSHYSSLEDCIYLNQASLGACQINSRVITYSPDTISECRKFHTGATAFIPTSLDKPFGSIFVSR